MTVNTNAFYCVNKNQYLSTSTADDILNAFPCVEYIVFDPNFPASCFRGLNQHQTIIGAGKVWHQAIIWINDDIICQLIFNRLNIIL